MCYDELEKMLKETFAAYLKVLSQCLLERTEKNYENPGQNSRFPARVSKPVPLEYEGGFLTIML
jgi:hypothetical protein